VDDAPDVAQNDFVSAREIGQSAHQASHALNCPFGRLGRAPAQAPVGGPGRIGSSGCVCGWIEAAAAGLSPPSIEPQRRAVKLKMRRPAAAEPVKDLSRRLEIRQTGFQAHWLGLVRRAERRYNEAETGGLENNAGIIEGGYFMYSNNSNGSRAAPAQGFAALWAVLALGLGALASPAAAAPFAYVTNAFYPGTVSVIDTATNTVVVTLAVGYDPIAVAVTPDGKHAYVTNMISSR